MAVSLSAARTSRTQFAAIIWSVTALGMAPTRAAEPAVEAEDLRSGLIAVYRDAAKPVPAEVVRLEPIMALNLKANESPHPRLSPEGGTVRWHGYLNVLRPGSYRFSVRLRGKLRLQIAGKEMLAAESAGSTPQLKEGPDIRLEAGVHPLLAEFTRIPGSALVELFWQTPYFSMESMGYELLSHVAKNPLQGRLAEDRLMERGRFLVEERNCASCHRPADGDKIAHGLRSRLGPDLSEIGQRAYGAWIFAWLASPHGIRPSAIMPQLFTDDDAGKVERNLVARYLASLGGPIKTGGKPPSLKDRMASAARGERLFTSIGCVACHSSDKIEEKTAKAMRSFVEVGVSSANNRLTGLGSKTTPEQLARYLENPLKIDPSGRMPHMLLQNKEAQDLTRYLCQSKDNDIDRELPEAPTGAEILETFRGVERRADELTAFRRLPPERQQIELGKRLVIDKGCNHCHTIAPGGQRFASVLANASFDDLKKPINQAKGCLADDRAKAGRAPWFNLEADDCHAVRQFLQKGTAGAGAPAPAYAARLTIQRFNCLACHSRDGEGGLTPEVVQELRRFEKAENAESVSPPPLTGLGYKLRTPWVKQVLTQAGRARPWMGLRMPQFGEANVGHLPETLAILDGTEPDDQVHRVPLTAAKLEVGRTLIGKQAFGCISCHDIAGVASTGTRGPDLALMNQRVRYPWYRRWLEHAQRMQPGTRMPTIFPDGKSPLPMILNGNADAQAEAMWAFLSLGSGLPLPEGLGAPAGLVVAVKDRPVLVRTFMPDAGTRAVAVGYPRGVAGAFDAASCRLAYAWSGNFLDASPVWDNRGGHPAKILGARFWTAPSGCPLAVTPSEGVPDFTGRAKDPAYGGAVPEGKLYDGPHQLQFDGYTADSKGFPTFRYRLNAETFLPIVVEERPEPLYSPAAVGIARHFIFNMPPQHKAWLLAGESNRDPRLLDSKGMARKLDPKAGTTDIPLDGQLLVLPQGGDKVLVLAVMQAPEGARWHLVQQGNSWQAILRLPASAETGKAKIALSIWAPYRDDPALLKELVSVK
jgi:cytochrome c2